MILVVGSESYLAKKFIQDFKFKSNLILTSRRDETRFNLDLASFKNLNKLPNNTDKALIFAGITGIEYCSKNKELVKWINLDRTTKLIKYLNARGIRCLFISSNCVFSELTNSTGEFSKREPSNIYGLYKKLVEDNILTSKLNSVLRLTKVLDSDAGILKLWKSKIINNEKIEAFSNIKISPITSSFVSQFIISWCSENLLSQSIFHLSNEIEFSYYDLALEVLKQSKVEFNRILKIRADLSKEKYFAPNKSLLECNLEFSRKQRYSVLIDEILNH